MGNSKRRLEVLTNEELAQVFKVRNRRLVTWLAKSIWSEGGRFLDGTKHVHYTEARKLSLAVMECLVELEIRTVSNNEWDTPYLAKSLGEGEYE